MGINVLPPPQIMQYIFHGKLVDDFEAVTDYEDCLNIKASSISKICNRSRLQR